MPGIWPENRSCFAIKFVVELARPWDSFIGLQFHFFSPFCLGEAQTNLSEEPSNNKYWCLHKTTIPQHVSPAEFAIYVLCVLRLSVGLDSTVAY